MSGASGGALAGVRVLDLSIAWAGPAAGRALAALGAEVIKIEAPARLDYWRASIRRERLPDQVPGDKPYNRTAYFNTQNMGKRSIGIDLAKPRGVELVLDLAAVSDLVLANFSGGVLGRLGLGRSALKRRNPAICIVEMPAFRDRSPMACHVGMGMTMEAACGMASMMAYEDGRPVLSGPAYLDPIGGLHGAAAALAGLWRARRTGRGCHVEVAQVDAAVRWIGEYLAHFERTGRLPSPQGNSLEGTGPHDAFPCRGADQWLALAVTTQDEWTALVRRMGRPDLAADPRYRNPADRWTNRDALYSTIAEWTRNHDKAELAADLQVAGVPAAPVNSGQDLVADGALAEIGFVSEVDHPEAGRHLYPGLAFGLRGTPTREPAPAPCFGEATDYVLQDVLGLDPEAARSLLESGVVRREPDGQDIKDS
ncbi:CaiB/BaiF CoA transferase family protein [Saccharopolyspora shandongensis]|uniref:CaiB/BaiF CoA transferase family protein n=1 Tax=Saccharopolyspora shandongensis TaxID=418495 RepID=UPI003404C832